MMKIACICGWTGSPDASDDGLCPRCVRKRQTNRPTFTIPPCPMCKREKPVVVAGHKLFRCTDCGPMFDDDPDEGTPEVYRDPVKSLEAKERREAQAKERRRR